MTIFAAWVLIPGALLFSFSKEASASGGDNTVRIGADVGVISSSVEPFLVPIFIHHAADVDAVHIGLDYDELMLRFGESWTNEDAIGEDPWYLKYARGRGRIELLVPFDPLKGIEEEVCLIQLEFRLASPSDRAKYGYLSTVPIHVDGSATYFLRTQDQAIVWPDEVQDGGINVYHRDALEIGSANISPDCRFFTIPVYVTHIRAESIPFSMGLDYDELYLDLVGVTPASKLLVPEAQPFDHKTEFENAWIKWPFVGGIYPQLFRHHLLDLHFEYRPGAGAPTASPVLRLIPNFDSSAAPLGGTIGEIREGSLIVVGPQFLRGDADGSGDVTLNDAFTILSFMTGFDCMGAGMPLCLDAMDIDMDGQIDITDAIRLLNFLYLSGSPPEPPFPKTGSNTPGSLSIGCDSGEPTFKPLPLPARI